MVFSQKWIILCLEIVDYSMLVNDNVARLITPRRGIHPGDFSSLYLLIIYAEGLTSIIKQPESNGDIHGVKV